MLMHRSSSACGVSITVQGYLPTLNLRRGSGSLNFVRIALLLASLAFANAADAQSSGSYSAPGSEAQPWSINAAHALVWGGKPYLPVGIRASDAGAIATCLQQGYRDLLIDLPANGMGWKAAISSLEDSKARYVISINSLAPPALGWAVDPESYRISGITKRREVHVSLPGATSVLAVTIIKRDGDVQRLERLKVNDGRLDYVVAPRTDLEHVLYLFPETASLETPDCWELLDRHRDSLLAAFRTSPPGKGLRGVVNPGGQAAPTLLSDPRFVPTSNYFRMEFRGFVESKYKNLETLQRAWACALPA